MTKKSFIIILVLSVVVTYGISIIDDLRRGSLLSGEGGIPFRFTSSSLFGGTSINFAALLFDIIFWFIITWVAWKLILKLANK